MWEEDLGFIFSIGEYHASLSRRDLLFSGRATLRPLSDLNSGLTRFINVALGKVELGFEVY